MSYFVRKQRHNGIDFTMYQFKNRSRGEAASIDGKLHLDGAPSITIADNQYKYGDEVIIQIFSSKGAMVKKERVNDNYDRVQIFLNKDAFLSAVKEIYESHYGKA